MKPPGPLHNPGWRLAGVLVLAISVVLYQTGTEALMNRVLLPIVMALATWMLVQNLGAVALGAALLAGIHSAPGSGDPIDAIVYPVLAAIATTILLAVAIARFRRHIAATHEARWERRHPAREPRTDKDDDGSGSPGGSGTAGGTDR